MSKTLRKELEEILEDSLHDLGCFEYVPVGDVTRETIDENNAEVLDQLEALIAKREKKFLEAVSQAMLDKILYIGEEVPDYFVTDKKSKFILLGYPQEFLDYLKQQLKK